MSDPDNALHTTLRIVWISGVALGALWVTATQLDISILWAPILIAAVSAEGFCRYQVNRAKREKQSQYESAKGNIGAPSDAGE